MLKLIAKKASSFFQKYTIGILDKIFHFKHSPSFCFEFHSSYAWNFVIILYKLEYIHKVENGTKNVHYFNFIIEPFNPKFALFNECLSS